MADGAAQSGGLTGGNPLARLRDLLRRGEFGLALGITTILVVLILPMPSWMLDISLAISITFSVLILMTVIFMEKPLDFSSFPMVLLIATMLTMVFVPVLYAILFRVESPS